MDRAMIEFMRRPATALALLVSLILMILAAAVPVTAQQSRIGAAPGDVAALERAILALGPGVDGGEAARAARIAYAHTAELARAYQIADSPVIHNTKVNLGLKPRGLCWHWAHDIEKRLKAEGFRTLVVHRAVANFDAPFRLEHSTAILSRHGDPYTAGIVLDPWRLGGELFWAPVAEDTRYDWRPRDEVLALKRSRATARADRPVRIPR